MSDNIFADIYNKILGLLCQNTKDESKNTAVNRLRLVLMQDRTNLTPEIMHRMRSELIEVLSKYVELDKEALDLNFEQEGEQMALMLSIPVVRAKDEAEIAEILKKEDEAKKAIEEKQEDVSEENENETQNDVKEEASESEIEEEKSETESFENEVDKESENVKNTEEVEGEDEKPIVLDASNEHQVHHEIPSIGKKVKTETKTEE